MRPRPVRIWHSRSHRGTVTLRAMSPLDWAIVAASFVPRAAIGVYDGPGQTFSVKGVKRVPRSK